MLTAAIYHSQLCVCTCICLVLTPYISVHTLISLDVMANHFLLVCLLVQVQHTQLLNLLESTSSETAEVSVQNDSPSILQVSFAI